MQDISERTGSEQTAQTCHNEFGDRNMCNGYLQTPVTFSRSGMTQAQSDEFGMFLIPLGDNTWYPTNPAGPTMFGYKGTEHEDLVKEFFNFVTTTESLQEILDNSPAYTNLDMNDDASLSSTGCRRKKEFLANSRMTVSMR